MSSSTSAYYGSGEANPFRPDGELSKEAEGIVSAIKNGTLNEVRGLLTAEVVF
jgi:hypothetical protein